MAFELLKEGMEKFYEIIAKRYDIKENYTDAIDLMDAIGKRRGCLMRGGEIDYTKVASIILDEFRNGTWGAISLEQVDDRHTL